MIKVTIYKLGKQTIMEEFITYYDAKCYIKEQAQMDYVDKWELKDTIRGKYEQG